jgi:hypothetical protein
MARAFLKWENVKSDTDDKHKHCTIKRAKVPGGWLIQSVLSTQLEGSGVSITFYPDPEYAWQ